jgi:hypothetical protein
MSTLVQMAAPEAIPKAKQMAGRFARVRNTSVNNMDSIS